MKSIPSFKLRRVIQMLASGVLVTSVVAAGEVQTIGRVQVVDPRPLAAVIAELEKRHGRVVTYEDPIRVHPSDIADITATVSRERRKGPVLIPKGGAFTFSYDQPKDESDSSIAPMLNSLVEQYNRGVPMRGSASFVLAAFFRYCQQRPKPPMGRGRRSCRPWIR